VGRTTRLTTRVALVALVVVLFLAVASAAVAGISPDSRQTTGTGKQLVKRVPPQEKPHLILTATEISTIRARLAAGLEPETSAFSAFMSGRVAGALASSPQVYAGPLLSGGVGSNLETALDHDGAAARNLALAYVLTRNTTYAARSREFLLAWATGNTPTTMADCGDKWAGSYQSHGAFMFAYAFDLTRASSVYSAVDKAVVTAWMRRFTDALDTFNTTLRNEWVMTHPDYKMTYAWDSSKTYYAIDNYIGGDMALLQQVARLAMARVTGYRSVVDSILNDPANTLGLESMSKASLPPRNDGDGVAGHPTPVPQVDVYKQPIAGRGGTIDYMSYNTRVNDIFLQIAENAGWNATKTAALRTRLKNSWDYLTRYMGPNAEPTFIATDVVSASACIPRVALAYHELGSSRYLEVLQGGDRSGYYEPQLVGPVTLTHSIR
jgi:hypothetical protein